MSAAHLHLVLNHTPLLGLLFGAAMLAHGLWREHEDVQKASLGLLAVAGLLAIAVYLTGEPAEEVVEGMAGVSHDALEAHDGAGTHLSAASRPVSSRSGRSCTVFCGSGSFAGPPSSRLSWPWGVEAHRLHGQPGGKVSHPEVRSNTASVEEQGRIEASGEHDSEEERDGEEE